MTIRRFIVVYNREPDGEYTVTVPALSGCFTEGDSLDEARKMAREAILLYLENLLAHGEPIPEVHSDTQFEELEVAV